MVSRQKTTSKQNTVSREKKLSKHNELIDGVEYSCDEYKNLIDKTFKFGLMDGDLYPTNFANKKLGMARIVNKYPEEK